jgi:beta-N-acetylhexosaminidase
MGGLGGAKRPFGIMLLNYSNSGNTDFPDSYREAPPQAECHYSLAVTADRRRWRARAVVTCAAVAVAVAAVAGCGPDSGGAATVPAASPRPSASPPWAETSTGTPSGAATSRGPAATTATPPAASCVNRVYGRLTEAQRVGQLFLVGLPGDVAGPATTAALQAYHFGSLLLAPSSAGVAALAGATAHMRSLATSSVTGGAGFYIAANQEGGQVQPLTGPGFSPMPSALTQGSWSVSRLRAAAAGWGQQLRAAGVNLNLAPVMDVVPAGGASSNAPIGALDRQFGSDPVSNGAHGAAFIAGMASAGVATTAKHFPGLGRVRGNTDFTAGVVDSVTTPTDPSLQSFRIAVTAGVPFVMVALATYTRIDPSRLAVFSPVVMQLLRSGLGFGGVIISDDLGVAAAVASIPAGERAVSFLSAGGDMITSQSLSAAETMASAVLARTAADPTFRAIVGAAAWRILAAKQAHGLLPC